MKGEKVKNTLDEEKYSVSLPAGYLKDIKPEQQADFIKKAVFFMLSLRGNLSKEKIISTLNERDDYKDLENLLNLDEPKNTKWSKWATEIHEEDYLKDASNHLSDSIKDFRKNFNFINDESNE